MAVQKSRVPRSRRGMRRSHDHLSLKNVSIDQASGEAHLRHHVTSSGFYRGKQLLIPKRKKKKVTQEESE